MTPPSADVLRQLAPTGELRAAINLGNPVLAQRTAAGELAGASVALAHELARRLGVPARLVPFDGAGKVFEASESGAWDAAFLAIDPVRAAQIAFTAPYVLIEGTYVVPDDSALRTIDDVDRDGVRIAVGRGAAYDLYLSRALRHAQLVRADTSAAALERFVAERLEAGAGVRQPLEAFARSHPGLRVMPGRFTAIEQAMGTPRGRDAALAYLSDFVEQVKASGFVAEALRASGQQATIAPPA